MSFLDEFGPEDLDAGDWEAMRMAAHFPTDDQAPGLRVRLGMDVRKEDWYKKRVTRLFEMFTGDAHRAGFRQALAALGLDPEWLLEKDGLRSTKRRAAVGALFWAHQAERRRDGAPEAVRPPDFDGLADDLFLPVQVLDASLVTGWRHAGPLGADIEVQVTDPLPRTLDEQQLRDDIWAELSGADDTPTLFGVERFQPVRVEAAGRAPLILHVRQTNYRDFKGTNDAFQSGGGRFASRAWSLGLGRAEQRDPARLQDSRLCNPLSVTCIAYLYDRPGGRQRLMGIQNRSFDRVHSGRYCLQATAGGFTTVAGDTLRDDRPFEDAPPDPFLTIRREFGEEAFRRPGLPEGPRSSAIATGDVTLLALVRDLASCWEVGLVGEIELPFTRQDIRDGLFQFGSDYFFEGRQHAGRDPIEWVEATPFGLARWLAGRRLSIGDFMPFGLAAIVLSFYHRGFSQREIHEALATVGGPGKVHLVMPDDPGWAPGRPPRPDLLRRTLDCWT